MNVLITGSEGFVGTKLQAELSSLGHQVFMTDRIKKSKKSYFKHNLGFDKISVLIDFFSDKKKA